MSIEELLFCAGERNRTLHVRYSLRAVLASLRAACSDFSIPLTQVAQATCSRHKIRFAHFVPGRGIEPPPVA